MLIRRAKNGPFPQYIMESVQSYTVSQAALATSKAQLLLLAKALSCGAQVLKVRKSLCVYKTQILHFLVIKKYSLFSYLLLT